MATRTLADADVDRIVIRGLYLEHGAPVTEQRIAEHYRLDARIVHESLLRLRRKRLARDRTRKGERVWEPWR